MTAESAVAIAMGRLAEDSIGFDHPAEAWCAHDSLASEDWLEAWTGDAGQGPAYVTEYHVIDEEGKLHVSRASSEGLATLGMGPDQIAALFDWIDGDDLAQAGGAENEYYLSLSPSYYCKNAPVEILDELVAVRGFSLADYLGEDANHNGLLDGNEDDGNYRYPPDDANGRLAPGWVNLLTCLGDGLTNLNTAPRKVLETLPISQTAVGQIIGYRAFDANSLGELEDHAFRSAEDIDQLQGLSELDRDVLKVLCTFQSTHFRIFARSEHIPTGLSYEIEVVVRRGGTWPEVLQWKVRP